jgi:hypothetical protein
MSYRGVYDGHIDYTLCIYCNIEVFVCPTCGGTEFISPVCDDDATEKRTANDADFDSISESQNDRTQ